MEQILLDMASKESLFAVMFVALFLYQIVDSRKREARLMKFMDDMGAQFQVLSRQYERLAEDVDDLKRDIRDVFRK